MATLSYVTFRPHCAARSDVSGWDNSQNYWMKALSQHYVVMNITATISWSLIWSV